MSCGLVEFGTDGTAPGCCSRRRRRWLGGHGRCSCTALNSDCHRFAVQRHILFFRRVEIRKCEHRQTLLVLVRRNHRLEGLCAADANFIVLFELGRRRIFMPAAVILEQRRIHPIEIAAPRDCCCDCDWITYLHALRLGIGCHGKASNRS